MAFNIEENQIITNNTIAMKQLFTLLLLSLSLGVFAQLSGTKTITHLGGGDYTSIAAAVTDLNGAGVGAGGVTFNVAAGHTESSTSQILLTATGTSSNPIVFQKSGAGANPVVSRTDAGSNTTSTYGGLGDAVIRINGSDYLTFDGIDVSASNSGIEYGYFTFKTATDGSQYITIKNCSVTMTKGTSAYVTGIYISNGPTGTSNATGVTVSANSGRNENVSITGCTIGNVHAGISIRGYNSTSYFDRNVTIGAFGGGNTIQNFGGGSATSAYGIYAIYAANVTVSYNTISNTAGGGSNHASTLYGVFNSTTSAGGISLFNNNSVTMGVSGTAAAFCINNSAVCDSISIADNILNYGSFSSTTASYMISNNTNTNKVYVARNQNSAPINKTGAGTFACYYNAGGPTSGRETIIDNMFTGITVAGSSSFTGIQSNTGAGQSKTISGNTINSITLGTGTFIGINSTYGNVSDIFQNEINTITGGGTVTGIQSGGTSSVTHNTYDNTIHTLSTSGASSVVSGIIASTATNNNLFRNRIYNLSSSTSGTTNSVVAGITISSGTNVKVYNNYISELYTTTSASTDAIRGINITSSTTVSTIGVYFNTIYLNASSSGANFGSSGLYHTYSSTATTAVLDMRNNIIVNNSNFNGTGLVVAFRRSAATNLGNVSSLCNNNCFYAGTPGSSNLLFSDGTNFIDDMGDLQTHLSPRESVSFSILPLFEDLGVSPMDLRIQTSSSTMLESGGQSVAGIPSDFEGNPRYNESGYIGTGTAPDVGADEFEGIPNYTCPTPAPGNTLASINSICLGNSVTLSLEFPTAGTGVSYQWKQSTDGIIYSDVPSATSATLVTSPTAPIYYKCEVTCQNGPETAVSSPVQITFSNSMASTQGATRCGTGTVSLNATAGGSGTLAWYASSSGGSSLGTGSPFTTPTISSTTSYYVAEETSAPAVLTLGAGATTTTAYNGPFYYVYGGMKSQYLIRASELIALGLGAGNIYSIGLDVTSTGTTFLDLDISIGTTAVTALASTFETGLTSVFSSSTYAPTVGINTFLFTSPFNWDGSSNLLVNICWSNNNEGGTVHSHVKNDATSYVSTNYYRVDLQPASVVCSQTARTGNYSARPKFIINGTSTCSSPRVEVIATVTPAPAFSISNDQTICNNAITMLEVLSPLANYDSYIWSPATDLYTDAAASIPYVAGTSATAVYFRSATAGNYTYTCNASNLALCANVDDVTITVMPAAPVLSASPAEICISGTTTLSVSPSTGYGSGTLQWQTSGDNVLFTDIPGANANTYTTPTITATTYYKLVIKNSSGIICTEPTITALVNNPQIVSSLAGTRCGIGTVTLEATASPGATINWYATATGGTTLGTGASFTTPVIGTTTDYYVGAVIGGADTYVGPVNPASLGSVSSSNIAISTQYLKFSVANSTTIESIDIFPTASIGSSFSIVIQNSSGTQLFTTGTLTTTVTGGSLQTVPINFTIPAGADFRMGFGVNPGMNRNTTGGVYPYSDGNVSITGHSFATIEYYYFFYNWRIRYGCAAPRTMVTATVTPPPALTLTPNQSACNDEAASIAVTSTIGDYDTYVWTPSTNLFTDAACTVPYVDGSSSATVYVKTAIAGAYTFTCTATNNTSNCVNITTSTVTVKTPILLTATATPSVICPGSNSQLNVNASQAGYSPTYSYLWSPTNFIASGDELLQNPLASSVTASTTYTVVVTGDGCTASTNVQVSVEPGVTILTQPQATAVCDGTNASYSVQASGPGLTYQWRYNSVDIPIGSNASAGTATLQLNAVSPLDAGAYDVVITALCGTPVTSDPALLTIKPIPSASASNNSPVCEGTPFTLSGTSDIGNEFYWTGPNGFTSTDQNPIVTYPLLADQGTYMFKAILNGCTSLVSNTSVSLNPMPLFNILSASPSTICAGQTVTLNALSTTGQTANLYSFSAGTGSSLDPMTGATTVIGAAIDDTPTASPAPLGFSFVYEGVTYSDYSVSPDGWLRLGTGVASSQFTNSVTSTDNIPKIYPFWDDAHTVSDGSVKVLLTGSAPNRIFIVQWNVILPRVTSGNANSTFQLWLFEGSNAIEFRYGAMSSGALTASVGLTGSTATNFNSVTVSSGTSSSTVANNSNAAAPAAGTIYTFLPPTPPTTYSWTPATELVDPLLASTLTNALYSTTTFTVTATGPNACSNAEDVTVTVNPLPTASTTLASTEYVCPGEGMNLTVDLTGTAPWSITVNDGSGPQVVSGINSSPWTYWVQPSVTTTYTITSVQDANCSNTANVSVTIDFHPVPAPVISGVGSTLCVSANATLNAGSGFSSYLWSTGATTQTINVSGSALGVGANPTYSVTVTNIHGCPGTASVTFTVVPLPEVTLDPIPQVCVNNGSFPLSGGHPSGGAYTGIGVVNGIFNPATFGAGNFTITYTYTDGNGCANTASRILTVNPLPSITFATLPELCIDAAPITLGAATPAGGTYSGTGVSNNIFDPAIAGAGNHVITYAYTNPTTTCSNTATKTQKVNPLPVALPSAAANPVPYGTPATLNGSASAGSGSYSFAWTPAVMVLNPNNASTQTVNIQANQTFNLVATDLTTGCVSIPAPLLITYSGGPLEANATSNPGTVCPGTPSQLNSNATGGTGSYNYTWSSNPAGFSSSNPAPQVSPSVTTTYTVLVNDGFNSTSSNVVVAVYPIAPNPVFAPITPFTASCSSANLLSNINTWLNGVSAIYTCGSVTISNDFQSSSLPASGCGTVTVTFLATDQDNNTSTAVSTITLTDNAAPVFAAITPFSSECGATGLQANINTWLNGVSATDNCGQVSISNNFAALTLPATGCGTVTVIFTASDQCNNISTASSTITLYDNTAPVFASITPFTASCSSAGLGAAIQAWLSNVGATDNCGQVNISNNYASLSLPSNGCGSITVIFTATDQCSNVSTATGTITLTDSEPPVFAQIQPFTSLCSTPTLASDINNWLNSVSASDNCGLVSISNNFAALSLPATGCGSITVTFTAYDQCNNGSTTTATITLTDNVAPVFATVPPITLNCSSTSLTADITGWLNAVSAADNCGTVSLSNDFSFGSLPATGCGSITVNFVAIDQCGNSSSATGLITITDNLAPVFGAIAPFSSACGTPTLSADISTWLNSVMATDNCGQVSISNNFTQLTLPVSGCGSITVTFTATDQCNNSTTASGTITITDNVAPVFASITPFSSLCSSPTLAADITAWLSSVSASDNCGLVSINNTYNQSNLPIIGCGTITVTFTAYDQCGNSSSANSTITLTDNIAPTLVCPSTPQTRAIYFPIVDYTTTGGEFDPSSVTDNCGMVTYTNNLNNQNSLAGYVFNLGITTIIWTAQDQCGNSSTCSFDVEIIQGSISQSFACPPSKTVTAPSNACIVYVNTGLTPYYSPYSNIVTLTWAMTGATTASSAPTGINILYNYTFNVGVTTITYTATDIDNLSVDCSFTVTVIDANAPILVCPGNQVLNLGFACKVTLPDYRVAASVSDNCSGAYMYQTPPPGTVSFGSGVVTVVITAVDASGNSSTCSFTVTKQDQLAPVFTACPPAQNINLNSSCTFTVPNLLTQAAASDNCGTVTLSQSPAAGTTIVSGHNQTTTVTITANDGNGNISTCLVALTAKDVTPPVLSVGNAISSSTSSDGTGNCSATIGIPDALISDNCAQPQLSWQMSGATNGSGSGQVGSFTFNKGITLIIYTLTDGATPVQASLTVTIIDDEAPVISLLGNDPVSVCLFDVYTDQGAVASDNCDGNLLTVVTNGTVNTYVPGTYTLTYTFTDAAGNVAAPVTRTVVVSPCGVAVTGNYRYFNTAQTPLSNITVALMQNNQVIYTATTNANGNYSFHAVLPGTYEVFAATMKPSAGAINSLDAAMVNAWGIGPQYSIDKVKFKAADVIYDDYLDAGDAARINAFYLTQGNPTWAAPVLKWSFWKVNETIITNGFIDGLYPSITVGYVPLSQDYYGLVTGDFNSSFIPGPAKSGGAISLTTGQLLPASAGSNVSLPILSTDAITVSAISMSLGFPADKLEVTSVSLGNDPSVQMPFTVSNGQLRIGWFGNPVNLAAGQTLLTLHLKLDASLTVGELIGFDLDSDPLNELGDAAINVINNAQLSCGLLKVVTTGIGEDATGISMLNCYPNPFRFESELRFTLAAQGKVTVEVFDMLGQHVASLLASELAAGYHILPLNASSWSTGVYTVRVTIEGDSGLQSRSVRIVNGN
jgi:trimeric autotransporter adhesin